MSPTPKTARRKAGRKRSAEPADGAAVEHELRRLNWALAAYAASVSTLVRSASPEDLMLRVCQSIVEQGVYVLAFVGLAEHLPGKPVRIVAKAGPAVGYADGLELSWDEALPAGRGPTGLAIRSGTPHIMRDAVVDPNFAHWRARGARYGIRSTVTVPFKKDGEVIGALVVYASAPDAFGAEELSLFERLAEQLAFAISVEEAQRELGSLEAARQQSEARYRALFDYAPDGILVADLQRRIVDANPSICQMLGYDRDELVALEAGDIVADREGEQIAPALEAIMTTAAHYREWLLRRKDGSTFPAEVVATLMPYGAIMAMVRDVTERHSMEAERREAEDMLRDLRTELARIGRLSMLGEFAATIAHEVNQPLAAIVANSDASLRWLAADPPNLDEVREALVRITRDSQRAHDVIRRTRAVVARREPEIAEVDLNQAIREVILMTRAEQEKSLVRVVPDLQADLPAVRGDRIELQQVILNLFLNSFEAMRSVTGRERVLTVRTNLEAPAMVRVSVQDSGEGFDPAASDRLFDHLFTTKVGGTGLGLGVSRSIIEAHEGRLWAEPATPQGAVFQFTVPVAASVRSR
jgi:PAS domain S-box-containing protein